MTCEECPLRHGCIEQRGLCRNYILYMEMVERTRKQIEKLNNENQAPSALRTVPADEGDIQETSGRGYVEALAGGRDTVGVCSEACADAGTSEKAEGKRNEAPEVDGR